MFHGHIRTFIEKIRGGEDIHLKRKKAKNVRAWTFGNRENLTFGGTNGLKTISNVLKWSDLSIRVVLKVCVRAWRPECRPLIQMVLHVIRHRMSKINFLFNWYFRYQNRLNFHWKENFGTHKYQMALIVNYISKKRWK